MAETSGRIVYEGPSKIDGERIVVIVTGMDGDSKNPKTGEMAQLWILCTDISPHQAIKLGKDVSICGLCRHRGINGTKRTCYVRVSFGGPSAVYRCYFSGGYPQADPQEIDSLLGDLGMRLGAYGDPAAIPVPVLRSIMTGVRGWTGYTHQWRRCHPSYRRWLMASVDSIEEYHEAHDAGWRTFRMRAIGSPLLPGEIDCPASDLQGHRLQCKDCLACNGLGRNNTPRRVSVSIEVHGPGRNHFSTAV